MTTSNTGAKLGMKIAHVVSTAIVSTQTKLLHVKHKLALVIFNSISDIISDEVHRSTGAILRQFHEDLPEDSIAHHLMKFMATEHGQLQAMAGTALTSGGILSSLAQIVNNELSPSVYSNLATNPHLIPDPPTFAQLAAKGLIPNDQAVRGIGENGMGYGWADPLIQAEYQLADVATLLDFLRRGLIDDAVFSSIARNAGYRGDIVDLLLRIRDLPLSAADAALAVLRGNMTQAEGEAIAAESGINAHTFQTLVDNTGEPIATEQLLEAFRRGFIDDTRLTKGIQQSRVRNEWIDVLLKLRFSPMSVADAVNAVVQNHLDMGTAASYAEQNGLEPDAFPILVETAGEPLSRTEMEQLFNRGLVTEDDVLQALRESRLKDKYTKDALLLHTRLLPMRNISEAIEYGSLSHADGIAKAMLNGYAKDDATVLVNAASARKIQRDKDKIVSEAETLYENLAMSEDDALAVIKDMGYDDTEAQLKLRAATMRRNGKLTAAATNYIRAHYIGHHIGPDDASSYLDAIGVPSDARDMLLKLWVLEHDSNVRQLTEAQLVKAYKAGLISTPEALKQQLMAMGYSGPSADVLVALA